MSLSDQTLSNPLDTIDWHAQDIDDVYTQIGSSHRGLTSSEVDTRVQQYGLNRLRPAKKSNALQRFLLQFHNVNIK